MQNRPKTRWPELLGLPAEMAMPIIRFQNPGIVALPIVNPGEAVTTDWRLDRVRLYVDDEGNLITYPMAG